MWGFNNLKDILDVIGIPFVIFVLGWRLAGRADRQRRKHFVNLIRRELGEAQPDPLSPAKPQLDEFKSWTDLLHKRFIHQDIFEHPSENRDFILSLDADLAYSLAQMWGVFADTKELGNDEQETYKRRGIQWVTHLEIVCKHLDRTEGRRYKQVFLRVWNRIIRRSPPPYGKLYQEVFAYWQGIIGRKYEGVGS